MISSLSRFGTSLPAYSTKPASSLPHARTTVNNPSTSIQRQGITHAEFKRITGQLSLGILDETLKQQIQFYIHFINLNRNERSALLLKWIANPEALPEHIKSSNFKQRIIDACSQYNTFLFRATKQEESNYKGRTLAKLIQLLEHCPEQA